MPALTCGRTYDNERQEHIARVMREQLGARLDDGCGEPLDFDSTPGLLQVYRCLECGRWLHKRCLIRHFDETGDDANAHPEVRRLRALLGWLLGVAR